MERIKLEFADYPEHTVFDPASEQAGRREAEMKETDTKDKHYNYIYFVKAVPHVFKDTTDENSPKNFDSWSYSMTSNTLESRDKGMTVELRMDFMPISMVLHRSSNSFSRFLVDLCAIVGGIFVTFGLLNGFLLGIAR
jgi:hypothetical protein